MKKNKNELPETITFLATLVKTYDEEKYKEVNEKSQFQFIWKTKPRLPKSLWNYLYQKKIAYGLKTEIRCSHCKTVLDSKVYWSFHIEQVKTELKFLHYIIISETEKEIVFQKEHSEVNGNDFDLSVLLKMPSDSFAFIPRCQKLLSFSFERLLTAMFLNVEVR
jgi:hypothetical protein